MDRDPGIAPVRQRSFTDRMIGAARLDRSVYEDVEHDTTATSQAAIVVGLAALAAAIGTAGEGSQGIFAAVLGTLAGWVVSSAFIYFAGTRLIPSDRVQADLGQVLRTQGFAAVPNLLLVLAFIPILGPVLGLVVAVWYIVTRIIGIQSSLEASVGRAIAIAIVAMVVYLGVLLLFGLLFGVTFFALDSIF